MDVNQSCNKWQSKRGITSSSITFFLFFFYLMQNRSAVQWKMSLWNSCSLSPSVHYLMQDMIMKWIVQGTYWKMWGFWYTLQFCAFKLSLPCSADRLFYLYLAKTDSAFKAFLDARNPTKQHSSTLESYLIKPVQRVLKYPLLLKELVSLTDNESEEHYHLTGNFLHSSTGLSMN